MIDVGCFHRITDKHVYSLTNRKELEKLPSRWPLETPIDKTQQGIMYLEITSVDSYLL